MAFAALIGAVSSADSTWLLESSWQLLEGCPSLAALLSFRVTGLYRAHVAACAKFARQAIKRACSMKSCFVCRLCLRLLVVDALDFGHVRKSPQTVQSV